MEAIIVGLEIINSIRKAKNMTVLELSKQSGVPVGTLNKILAGTTQDPKLETLKALARVLNCKLDDFNDTKPYHQVQSLTADAMELLECYQLCDAEDKEELLLLARHKAAKNTTAASKYA